jgi:hypothetical protein
MHEPCAQFLRLARHVSSLEDVYFTLSWAWLTRSGLSRLARTPSVRARAKYLPRGLTHFFRRWATRHSRPRRPRTLA